MKFADEETPSGYDESSQSGSSAMTPLHSTRINESVSDEMQASLNDSPVVHSEKFGHL